MKVQEQVVRVHAIIPSSSQGSSYRSLSHHATKFIGVWQQVLRLSCQQVHMIWLQVFKLKCQ